MKVLLLSTYELGRQPFGLASPAAWLRERGAEVVCLDLSRVALREEVLREADLVAFFVPMHTATRLAAQLVAPVRRANPRAHLCFYGLYAPVNEAYLRKLGVQTLFGGEFEEGLARLVERLKEGGREGERAGQPEPLVSLARQAFRVPDRAGLPSLRAYAHLVMPDGGHRVVGYTEASRGCKHRCRHCPVVPVYQGAFRIVPRDVVLEDVRRQVEAGAEHITFGDPDFFNGVGHARALVEEFHRRFPGISYDVTIKVEHLKKHADHLRTLRETGCRFVTTAVESVDDAVLARLEKGHTRADFVAVLAMCREAGLALHPTFVPFTPWTTLRGYAELLALLVEQDLVAQVAPIQLAIRLLVPAGSRLLELPEVRRIVGAFDEPGLVYPWRHPEERVERLCADVQEIVRRGEKLRYPRARIFLLLWQAAHEAAGLLDRAQPPGPVLVSRAAVPYLNEPWYC